MHAGGDGLPAFDQIATVFVGCHSELRGSKFGRLFVVPFV
jgi:hypothetical protein